MRMYFSRRSIVAFSQKNHLTGGFTLVEAIISIGIIAILIGVAGLGLIGFKLRQSFILDSQLLVESIRNAHNRALFQEEGSVWGIRVANQLVTSDSVEIFSGSSYATSTVVLREDFSTGSVLLNPPSGNSETITFTPRTGTPSHGFQFVLGRGDEVRVVGISSLGATRIRQENGLWLYWPFDEGSANFAYDASGNGYTGSVPEAKNIWQATSACVSGTCLSLNGTSDFVKGGEAIGGSDPRTVTFWMSSSNTDVDQTLVGWGTEATGTKYHIRTEANLVRVEVGGGWARGTHNVVDGEWHHVAVVFSGSDVTDHLLYVDGESDPIGYSGSQAMNTAIDNEIMAGSDVVHNRYFYGLLDDVRVYNRALSANEVKELYESY